MAAQNTPLKLNAGVIQQMTGSDLVPTINLGTGAASSSNYLRGDGSWFKPVTSLIAGIGITLSGTTGAVTITNSNPPSVGASLYLFYNY